VYSTTTIEHKARDQKGGDWRFTQPEAAAGGRDNNNPRET